MSAIVGFIAVTKQGAPLCDPYGDIILHGTKETAEGYAAVFQGKALRVVRARPTAKKPHERGTELPVAKS